MSLNNIRFISTSTVPPAASDDDHKEKELGRRCRIELTPWDLRLALWEPIQKGLLFHKPAITNGDSFSLSATTTLIDHLKATLSQALQIFYPLTGRLAVVEDEDGGISTCTATIFMDCNGAGALFVHAAIDGVTVADILHPVVVPDAIVYSLFPMNGVLNVEAAFSGSPLLAVQVTELVDGIFIACTMNHCAGDGTSFWHFFNVWSEISRGYGLVCGSSRPRSPPPLFCREFLDGFIDLPISIPLSRDAIISKINRYVPPPNLQQRIFSFSKEKITKLKNKANSEMGIIVTKSNDAETISSLQALLAHLWISITRNRPNLDLDEEVCYMVAVGMRPRIQPPLPKEYFGNSVRLMMPKCTARELLERRLGWAAWEINRKIASVTPAEVRKSLEDWAKSFNLPHLGKFPPNTLITGSSPRFDVYGNDFGWGRPVTVRSGPAAKFDGKLTVFPGADEGSIDFEVCLLAETLEAMACDADFVETLAK